MTDGCDVYEVGNCELGHKKMFWLIVNCLSFFVKDDHSMVVAISCQHYWRSW